jgi:hypothetical protein
MSASERGELEVAGRLEFDILTEPFGQPVPERARPARQWQLGEVATLLADAAEVDAARARAAETLVEDDDRQPRVAQRDGGGAAGDAAADDRDVDAQSLAHGRSLTRRALPRRATELSRSGRAAALMARSRQSGSA